MAKNRKIPFGYMMKNGAITTNPKEVLAVVTIFRSYLNGDSLTAIAQSMEVPYNEGVAWNKNMVKRIIENEKYLGTDKYPHLIDENTFRRANVAKVAKATSLCVITDDLQEIRNHTFCKECGHRLFRKGGNTRSEKWDCCRKECYNRIGSIFRCDTAARSPVIPMKRGFSMKYRHILAAAILTVILTYTLAGCGEESSTPQQPLSSDQLAELQAQAQAIIGKEEQNDSDDQEASKPSAPSSGDALCDLLNENRAEKDQFLTQLTLDADCFLAAQQRVLELSNDQSLQQSHKRPDGSSWETCFAVSPTAYGEVILSGMADVQRVYSAMMQETTLRAYVQSADYTNFGYACNETQTIWVLIFSA